MAKMMEIELVQLACKDGDVQHNFNKVCDAVSHCASTTDLLVFPETYLSGFPTKENLESISEPLNGKHVQRLIALSQKKNIAIAIGLSEQFQSHYYNTTIFITPEDGLLAYYRKTHLWLSDRGIFDAGDSYSCVEWRGIRIGFLICFDIEFPESARAIGELGAELLIVTNGNMDPYGQTHRTAIMARAQENQFYAVMVNRVGSGDNDLTFAGGSCVVNPAGQLLCEARREECSIKLRIDPSQVHQYKRAFDYIKERKVLLAGQRVDHNERHSDWIIAPS